MEHTDNARRMHERQALSLPVRVECRESQDYEWDEMSQLLDVTPFGARFTISRPTEPGRLLHLSLPMPRELRSFDHDEELYRVWALVRHVKPLPSAGHRLPRFDVGVALVGKEPPATFETDPAKRYEVASPPAASDFYSVREHPEPDTAGVPPGDRRAESRQKIALDIVIEVYDAEGQVFARETTKTENISQRGMAVTTALNIVRGRYVRVRSPYYQIAVIAAVRRLRRGADGAKRLHLEFVDQQWPLLAETS